MHSNMSTERKFKTHGTGKAGKTLESVVQLQFRGIKRVEVLNKWTIVKQFVPFYEHPYLKSTNGTSQFSG